MPSNSIVPTIIPNLEIAEVSSIYIQLLLTDAIVNRSALVELLSSCAPRGMSRVTIVVLSVETLRERIFFASSIVVLLSEPYDVR